jgi:tetratricopeptide (TPR) repeat protein
MAPTDVWAHMNLGQTYRDLGLLLAAQGKDAEALDMRRRACDSYVAAIRIGSDNPFFPLVYSEMGKVFMDAGYYDQAIISFNKAAEAFPERTEILYSLGLCHFTLREYSLAIEYLEQVVRLSPDSPITVWGMLAKSHEERGDNRRAIQVYESARSRYPTSADISYNLGVLYHRVGDVKTAIERLELALQLAPDGPLAVNARRMIELMKEDLEEIRINQSYESHPTNR